MVCDESPADFLRRHADAFQRGDYAQCARDITVPTVIHVADKRLIADRRMTLIDILRIFRQNLMVEGYARTEVEFFHHDQAKDDVCRTLLQWRNVNSKNAKINQMDTSYFLRRGGGQSWQIELMEIFCDGSRYLADGLALH